MSKIKKLYKNDKNSKTLFFFYDKFNYLQIKKSKNEKLLKMGKKEKKSIKITRFQK